MCNETFLLKQSTICFHCWITITVWMTTDDRFGLLVSSNEKYSSLFRKEKLQYALISAEIIFCKPHCKPMREDLQTKKNTCVNYVELYFEQEINSIYEYA